MEGSIDYEQVGLRVGLEVHQQLLTDQKMFCRCPAGLYTETHDGVMLRHMRPTLSELGEYDGTALMEFKTKKNIVYLLHKSNVCTYEMDDTPPFIVNRRAIDIAIEQCLMLGCDVVDEVHIARKQYLDGSIPTGFQRTAIVGVNGRLPFRGRELTVIQVSVEEDSCREVQDRGHLAVWRTDRLGMPLIETVTGPELTTPEEVEEAILLIGRVGRSTGHVRVGMGASRQDVNVSVRGGRRVEIKGVPKASHARQLVHSEAVRQVELLKLRDELHRRGFEKPSDIVMEHVDITTLVADFQLDSLQRDNWQRFVEAEEMRRGMELAEGPFSVRAIRLPRLAGTIGRPCQPGRTFAHELAGRVRVIATLDQPPILVDSDDWPDYPGGIEELEEIRQAAACTPEDALVVVWGIESDTITAAKEIQLRFAEATEGIPHETRQALDDGCTDFERILPGPDRMYPDTDSPPQRVTRERVERLQAPLPEPPWLREERYGSAGVPKEVIHFLIRRGGARLVDLVVAECGADLRRACFFFGERIKGLRRAGVPVDTISDQGWCDLFLLFGRHPMAWEAWRDLVLWLAAGHGEGFLTDVEVAGFGHPPEEWRDTVRGLAEQGLRICPGEDRETAVRYLMGRAMDELRGRVPAAEVESAIRDLTAAGNRQQSTAIGE